MYKEKKIYSSKGKNQILYAIIYKYKKKFSNGVKFLTPNHLPFQIGIMSHNKGHKILPHYHKKNKYFLNLKSECLYILSGKLRVNFFVKKKIIKSSLLQTKDIILLLRGGHSFSVIKKCKMIEVKQGPFYPFKDKILI
jgi:hypothetical protein